MKRKALLLPIAALGLALLFGQTSAEAALGARSAVIDPATGYPTWYQDTNNLALTNCLDQNGFCLAAFTGAPLPASKAQITPANFPAESFFYMADATGTSPGGTISLTLWEAALEASFAANVQDGGQAVFSRIRIRANVTLPGTYVVTHPYGVNTFVVDAIIPGHEINFTNDIPGLVAGAFDAAVAAVPAPEFPVVGPRFLTNAAGTFVTDPTTGNRYLGFPGAPVTVTGGPNGNILTITAPNGDNLTITQFGLQGKVIGMDVQPSPKVDLGATNIITPALVPKEVKVTNTTGSALTFAAIAPAQTAGTDFADFLVTPPSAVGAVNCVGAPVAPGASCSFDVIFSPAKIAKGARAASIVLAPAAAVPPEPPPVTLNLSGIGKVSVTSTAVGHGTITPPVQLVDAGSNVTMAVAPANNKFKIKDVADGAALVAGPPFTFNAGADNHAVTANFMPSGDLNASGALDLGDAIKALKIVAGTQVADSDDPDNTAIDTAPLVAGKPAPDHVIDIGDVLVILRRVLNLESW